MHNPAAFSNTRPVVICRQSERCHRWLDGARSATGNPGIQRLIDDVQDDLLALGPIDGETRAVVHGALESVAAAIDADLAGASLN